MKSLMLLMIIGSIIAIFTVTDGQPLDYNDYINLDDLFTKSEEDNVDNTVEVDDDDYDVADSDIPTEADTDGNDQVADDEEIEDDALDIRAEEEKDMEKRKWIYKCEDKECNARCLRLLELPSGRCGYQGKCFCSREKV